MSSLVRHSKKDAKIEKMNQKQQTSIFSRKDAQRELKNLEEEKNQSQYQDPIVRRAMRQWKKLDQKYFLNITIDQVVHRKNICTSYQVRELGGLEPSYLLNYREEMVYSNFPIMADKNKIRVLFKYPHFPFYTIGIFGLQTAIPNYNSQNRQCLQDNGIKITTKCSKEYRSMQDQNQNHKIQNINQIKAIKLDLEDFEEKQTICERVCKIDQIDSNMMYLHQIDKQIALWQWQLEKANQNNTNNWDKLIQRMENDMEILKVRETDEFDSKIMKYRDKLYWATVLRSFQHGFKEKTKKMLQVYIQNEKNFNLRPPKGIVGQNPKKYFETDCKICFCSDNNDSNQVLYCDNCNTSFHLACYGLTSVPQEQQYFCERCTYLKKQQLILGARPKRPYCQICFKTSFPMKKIEDHLYHVTCLILFNLVQFRNNKMVLKGSLTHQNIMKMVIENQLLHDQCCQCRKIGGGAELGMQIKCSYQGCQNYCHPICAYLNGCKFQLKATNSKSLNVKMFCNDHLGDRAEQVYLRRYMCNQNETSSKSYEDFVQMFQKDQQNLINSKQTMLKTKKKYPNRILMLTKFVKSLFKSRMERQQEQIVTQTQSILNKLKKNSV